jgi:YD repeat-containing protein
MEMTFNPTSSKRLRDFSTTAGPLASTTYDASGLNPVQITRTGDKTGDGIDDSPDSATLIYDSLGRQTQGIDADWQVTQTQYDTVDRATRATDPLGNWRDYKYDANGNLIEDKLVNNGQVLDRATHDYDFSDRPERSWDSAGSMSAAQYDAAGNPIRLTDADGYSAQIQYDAMNRPVSAQDQEGNSVATAYDPIPRFRGITLSARIIRYYASFPKAVPIGKVTLLGNRPSRIKPQHVPRTVAT